MAVSPVIPSPRTVIVGLLSWRRGLRLGLTTLLVGVLFSLTIPAFATHANLVTMLADASVTGIAAVGLFLVVLSGGIDLSIGAVAALAPLIASLAAGHAAAPGFLLVALGVGGAIGLVAGLLIIGGGVAAFAVTLAGQAIVQSVAGTLASAPGRAGTAINLFPALDTAMFGMPASLALFAAIAGLVAVFLSIFSGGRVLIAVGSDREAARAAGLDVTFHGVLPYVVAGILASVAGLLSATAAPSSLAITELNGTLTLDALAAVIIGGTSLRGGRGTLLGVLLGVALIVMIRSGLWLLDLSMLWQGGVVGGLLLVGLVVDRLTDPRAARLSGRGQRTP